jgi:hypothetical protein
VCYVVLIVLLAGILLDGLTAGILELFGFPLPKRKPDIPMLTWVFPFQLLFLAFVEEIKYRAPLILLRLADQERVTGLALFLAAVFSVVFGINHGGWQNIFVQGSGGFLYCLLFLKAGGISGNFFRALAATTGVHFLHNSVAALIQLVLGATCF